MEAVRRLVERLIIGSPFARVLALEPIAVEPDRVRVRMPWSESRTTIGDLIHGGAIAALVDVAATAACWSSESIASGSRGTTVGLTIQFLNGARATELVAEAEVVQRGRSLCAVGVSVHDAGKTEVARALVSYKLDAPRTGTSAAGS